MKRIAAAREHGTLEGALRRFAKVRPSIRIPYYVQPLCVKLLKDEVGRSGYFHVRYGPPPKAGNMEEFNALAASIANRIELPDWISQNFFGCREDQSVGLQDWQAVLKFAAAQEQVARDLDLAGQDIAPLYHPDTRAILETLAATPGALVVLTSHFGSRFPRLNMALNMMKDFMVVMGSGSFQHHSWNTISEAAFVAMRVLASGGKIFVGPDAPNGGNRQDIRVKDFSLDVAQGPVVLAHCTGAHVKWLHVEMTDEGFLPVIVDPGIKADPAEPLLDFGTKVNDFYAGRVAYHLAGPAARFLVLPVMEKRLRKAGD